MAWIEYAAALALFLLSHRIPAALGLKSRLEAALGRAGYIAVFSVISTLLLYWVVLAAGRAPFVALWDQALWHRWAVNLAMPVVVALAAFGVAAPNPFAFEGRAAGFDPARPGIVGLTRQPLLWAMALWSAVHLLANGDLAHVILFGLFLGFSILGLRLVETRRRRTMGEAEWTRLAARTGLVPFATLASGRWRPSGLPSVWRAAVAVIAWAALLHLHAPVIGVSPLP